MSIDVIHHMVSCLCHGSGTTMSRFQDAQHLHWMLLTGLGPVLADYPRLKECLDPEENDAIRASDLQAKVVYRQQVEALSEILERCQQEAIPVTLLKGQSMARRYYEKPWFRQMRDMDILVPESRIQDLSQILYAAGYHQESKLPEHYYDGHHHLMPFHHGEKGIWIEAHTQLFRSDNPLSRLACFSPQQVKTETLWHHDETRRVGHLSPELNLVYLSCHWADEFKPMGGLNVFMDLSCLLGREQIDWQKIRSWLEDPLVAVSVYHTLSYLKRLGCDQVPEVQLAWLTRRHPFITGTRNRLMHHLLNRYYVSGRAPGRLFSSNNLDIIWDNLVYYHGPNLLGKMLWELLFPPSSANRYSAGRLFRRVRALFR